MPSETREERIRRRKKRKRETLIFYAKLLFFVAMVVILVWCLYAFIFQSNLMKDRRDTGQVITSTLNN